MLFRTYVFDAKLNVFEHFMEKCLQWVERASVPAAKEIICRMKVEVLQGKSRLNVSQFLTSENMTLRQFETEHILQVPRASLAVKTYAMKEERTAEFFFNVSARRAIP